MKTSRYKKPKLLWGLLLLLLSSCHPLLHQPMQTRSARLGEESTTAPLLRQLPPPAEKIVAAVYKFRDQTGQYKPTQNGASYSTAVTQGATSILLKSLEDSGWFKTIERENVANLLNERKIIRSSRQQYLKPEEKVILPPLLYAGVILEGGIVSYDANVITGGAGLRYFGMGGSGQYRQDRVTVYLRLISTQTGEILKTVYTSKTVLSQTVDVGLFQFVKFKRLLEVETGFTYNEPAEMVVTEAIEKAVHSLIIEGLIDGLWTSHPNADELVKGQIQAYQNEKADNRETDLLNSRPTIAKEKFHLSLSAAALRYEGDYAQPKIRGGVEIGIARSIKPQLSVHLNFGAGSLASERFFKESFGYGELNLRYQLVARQRFSPFVSAGGGWIGKTRNSPFEFTGEKHAKLQAGLGWEFRWRTNWSVQMMMDHHYFLSDMVDALDYGKFNDYYWRLKVGVVANFGKLKNQGL